MIQLRESDPPAEWGVEIDTDGIRGLADRLADHRFEAPAFDYEGIPELDGEEWARFVLLGVSVVWRLWPPDGEPMWAAEDDDGNWLEDAPGIWTCFARDEQALDLDRVAAGSLPTSFFDGRGTLQDIPGRMTRLRAVAGAIRHRFDGSALGVIEEAGGDAEAVSGLITEALPGYLDRPPSPVGPLHFDKLSNLATAMLAARLPVTGVERFPVYPDYMLPMHLRHRRVLAYEPELAAAVDSRSPIPAHSRHEMGIRWATIRAAESLRRALDRRGNPVSTPELDYWLWSEAVLGPEAPAMGEHHRCLTTAY